MINDDYNHDVSGEFEYKYCVCRFHTRSSKQICRVENKRNQKLHHISQSRKFVENHRTKKQEHAWIRIFIKYHVMV